MGIYWDGYIHRHTNDPLAPVIFAHDLLAGTIIKVGHSYSTVYPDLDFETYSEAGYQFDDGMQHFIGVEEKKKGLDAVGTAVYAAHPSTEVLCLSYNLKDGLACRLWYPHMPPPADLLQYVLDGGLLEAHHSMFEYLIWSHVCTRLYGWPALALEQLRCSMAKAAAFSLPSGLDKLGKALNSDEQKDTEGYALMRKMTVPRKPTAKDKSLKYTYIAHPAEFKILGSYCVTDIKTESSVSARIPDLSPTELNLWLLDQRINLRGAPISMKDVDNCIEIVIQAFKKYTDELRYITNNICMEASKLEVMKAWLISRGVRNITSMDADHIEELLARNDLPPDCRRVVEIRSLIGSASIKKLYAIKLQANAQDRLQGLFAFCGADRTGRFAGRGPQPQNLPAKGPELNRCDKINGCGHHYGTDHRSCPWCGADASFSESGIEWHPDAVEQAFSVITHRRLDVLEWYYGSHNAIAIVAGCLRGIYHASEGFEFICSDFSAIEGVVAGELAGETWRQEVFRGHGKIYEMSAAKTSGIPLEELLEHKKRTKAHHPLRKMGKVGELASTYGGWIPAWKNFGADEFMNDEEIKRAIIAWRAASPNIVEMWGGQIRRGQLWGEWIYEYYGLEGAAVQAIMNPGQAFQYRDIIYQVHDDVMYCRLPSGRLLNYHQPRLLPTVDRFSKKPIWQITYMGQNTTKQWVRLDTYGGKLFENVVQAVARDILTFAMVNLEAAGYWIVLHIHDEIVSEVQKGWGSIEEFERIMSTMPPWAAGWPVKAAGGWRGLRYRKEP